jgi:hypothetical protein
MLGARLGRDYDGAIDSISCSAGLQTTEEAVGASGTSWQDHRVPECRDKEICLVTVEELAGCGIRSARPSTSAGVALRRGAGSWKLVGLCLSR